jgi:hypothetical protein
VLIGLIMLFGSPLFILLLLNYRNYLKHKDLLKDDELWEEYLKREELSSKSNNN